MPLDQQIKGCHGKGHVRQEILSDAVHDLFEIACQGEHRQHGFDNPVLIPLATWAELKITRIPFSGVKADIAQNDHVLLKQPNQRLEDRVMDMGGGTDPAHYQLELIDQQAQLAPDDPAMTGQPLASNLNPTASFPNRRNQPDPVGIRHPQHRRAGFEVIRPGPRRLEQAKQPRALGQMRKQRPIIPDQPAIEGAVTNAFEGMQYPECDQLTGPQPRLGMLKSIVVMCSSFHGKALTLLT